jgi:universal stress protein A
MRIKPTTEAGQVLVELDRKDEALLDQANALNCPPASAISLKRILVPVDFSHCSKEALAFAVSFARQFGANLAIIHVVYPSYTGDPCAIGAPGYIEPDLTYHAEKQLEYLAGETVPREMPWRGLVRTGRPAQVIIEAAKELEADLIIISSHGTTGLKRVVFGSTTEYVVRHAKCAVLTVRATENIPEE